MADETWRLEGYCELPSDNGGADFTKVILINGKPACKEHGAMNKVSDGGYWRCIHSWKCRAGCKEIA